MKTRRHFLVCLLAILSVALARRSYESRLRSSPVGRVVELAADSPSTESFMLLDDIAVEPPPPCISNVSELGYINGALSASQTFYTCLSNIPDAAMISSFYNGAYNGMLRVNTSITLNNLEAIDEIQGTARLQFSLRLFWRDDRYAMPEFWNQTSLLTQSYGIDLTSILLNDSVLIWLPQLRFPDASDISFTVSYLKLNSSNVFEWGTSVDATLMQPKFDFTRYPTDTQTVNIRYIVFNFATPFVQMGFWGAQSLKWNINYDGTATFKDNPIWSFESVSWSNFEGNGFTYALYQIVMKRQGQGIVLRLVLPITLLLLLAGMTFWVRYENRVDTTITLLLSISALYIVILTNIPLVGYLTDVDNYVFWMFLLLICVIILHQIYATLYDKKTTWPLRLLYMRAIETIGRVFLIPFVLIYFVLEIVDDGSSNMARLLLTAAVVFIAAISTREGAGLKRIYTEALIGLVEKINNPDTSLATVSWTEVLFVNAFFFDTYTTSTKLIADHFSRHDKIIYDPAKGIRLKDINTIGGIAPQRPSGIVAVPEPQTVFVAQAPAAPKEVEMGQLNGHGVSPLHHPETDFRRSEQNHHDSDDEV